MNTQTNIDLSKLLAPNLTFKTKPINGNIIGCCDKANWISCGSASLELVTGIEARKIDKYLKNPEIGWHTPTLIKYLKELGFTAIELTYHVVTRPHGKPNWRRFFPVQKEHCLMINATLDRDDNSWFLLHNNIIYHHNHFQCNLSDNPLFFFNKQIQNIVLVHHKSWA
jgi:hypothetical protein